MRQEYHYGTIVEHVPELFGDKAPNSCTLFLPAASTGRHKSQLATMHSVTPNALFPHTEGEGERWSQSRIPINAPHRQFSRERTIMRLLPGEKHIRTQVKQHQKWCKYGRLKLPLCALHYKRNQTRVELAMLLAAWANLAAMPVLVREDGRGNSISQVANTTRNNTKTNYRSLNFVSCIINTQKRSLPDMRVPAEVPHVS